MKVVTSVTQFIHRWFIWCLLSAYLVAGIWPARGLWIRSVMVGHVESFGQRTVISVPMVMLAFLLLNAGLGIELAGLKSLRRNLKRLLFGVAGNVFVPLAFIFAVSRGMGLWHNPSETQNTLVGLALVASMPIAGSSTAWSQNANGNMTVSLGLVLATTFLSPLTTPLALHAVGSMTTGDYSEDLHELASNGTGMFLAICVILPSIAGILGRLILGKERVTAAKPYLKLVNYAVLLTLVYSNASVSLPKAVSNPDPDFLAIMLLIAVSLCSLAFSTGWLISRNLQADRAQRTSLMFGLGMNNNGTGLVLALFAQILLHDAVLDPFHEIFAVKANHGSVNAGVHDAEGIRGGDKTVVRGQVFKARLDDAHIRQLREPLAERVTHFGFRMDQPEIDGQRHMSVPVAMKVYNRFARITDRDLHDPRTPVDYALRPDSGLECDNECTPPVKYKGQRTKNQKQKHHSKQYTMTNHPRGPLLIGQNRPFPSGFAQ